MGKRVLGVGHCGFDSPRIARVVESLGGSFKNVATVEQALAELRSTPYALVMPNRVIGGDEEGGLNMIRAVRADPRLQPVAAMLVSAIAEAQQAAEAAGAVRGIGKDILESEQAVDALRPYVT